MHKDITGKRFGKLTAAKFAGVRGRHSFWQVRCDCGKIKIVRASNLAQGGTRSCGCLSKLPKKDGKSYFGSPTYEVWANMLSRCRNKNTPMFHNYGGRGITVCLRWHKFDNFLADMGDKPPKKSIDRIDNNGNYCKKNCRWATPKEQANNRRNNVFVVYDNKEYSIEDLAKKLNIHSHTIKNRLARGYPITERIPSRPTVDRIDLGKFIFSDDRISDMQKIREMGASFQQIGNTFGISRQRVKQLLDKIKK